MEAGGCMPKYALVPSKTEPRLACGQKRSSRRGARTGHLGSVPVQLYASAKVICCGRSAKPVWCVVRA